MFRQLRQLIGFDQDESAKPGKRNIDIGWLVDTPKAEFIYDAPQPFRRPRDHPKSGAKAVQKCPSVLDMEARYWIVPCPFDLRLKAGFDKDGKPVLINNSGPDSSINRSKIKEIVHLTDRKQWRHPDRPVIQIGAPYRFLSDDDVWMNQLPPFLHFQKPAWPGTLISGRLPIKVWPRIMMWAFEWHDLSQELVLRRGDPWFYVHFESDDPTRKYRMVHAEMTEALKRYCAGTDGVTNYVNRTWSLFDVAAARRPDQLLVPFHNDRDD